MGKVVPMFGECVCCLQETKYRDDPPSLAVLTILLTLSIGHSLEEIVSDMCFSHRRELRNGIGLWKKTTESSPP